MKNLLIIIHIILFFNWLIYLMVGVISTPKSLAFEIWGLTAAGSMLFQIGTLIYDSLKEEGYTN